MKRFLPPLLFCSAVMSTHIAQAQVAQAQDTTNAPFPFVMPWDDASKNVVDVSFLNPPITEKQRLSVKNGRFVDASGQRVKILGTNITSSAPFSSKSDAAKVAARLSKMGINTVRLHHIDAPWANPNIFGRDRDNYNSVNEKVDAQSLDAMEYFVYELKRNGIYTNLNLHVSWGPNAAMGYPDTDKIPELGKVTSYFEKRSIEQQKSYARQILTHVNPYTKLSWANDPAVAFIEITNEDTLLGEGWGTKLINLPPYYRDQLRDKWNAFLKKKYANTSTLKAAWGGNTAPGPNILQNPQFQSGTSGWTLEQQKGAVSWTTEDIGINPGTPLPQGRAVKLSVSALGDQTWHLQFHQNGLDLKEGEPYTITFWAKADKPRDVNFYASLDQAPWSGIGGNQTIQATPEWKKFSVLLTPSQPVANHNRISWILGNAVGDLWLADVSVQRGYSVEIPAGQSLETGNIALAQASGSPQGRDVIEFLVGVESEYSQEMYRFVKNELGAKGLVTCSQAWLGGIGGVLRESRMDFVDHHSYWQHPNFPRRPWDAKDWNIGNTPMVRDSGGGTFPHLALHRVAGKPFTVSEYNHAAPNEYASETMPIIAAYAAWQDWDGIYLFDYNGDHRNWNEDQIRGFFSADTDPNKMAFMPAAALIFRAGLMPASAARANLQVPQNSVVDLLARNGLNGFWDSNVHGIWGASGLQKNDWLASRAAISFITGSGAPKISRLSTRIAVPTSLSWNADGDKSRFTMAAPGARVAIGFLGGQTISLGDASLQVASTPRNWATITITARDRKALPQSSQILLTVMDKAENQGMTWNAERNSVSDQWGTGPVLAQTVPATVSITTKARTATVHALDATGKRTRTISSTLGGGKLSFKISPSDKAVWYEIAATH
jgi:hypothetical protein